MIGADHQGHPPIDSGGHCEAKVWMAPIAFQCSPSPTSVALRDATAKRQNVDTLFCSFEDEAVDRKWVARVNGPCPIGGLLRSVVNESIPRTL